MQRNKYLLNLLLILVSLSPLVVKTQMVEQSTVIHSPINNGQVPLAETSGNYYYVDNGSGSDSTFNLIKYSPTGSPIWTKAIYVGAPLTTKGYPYDMTFDNAGNILVAGMSYMPSVGGYPVLSCVSASGMLLWERYYVVPGFTDFGAAKKVEVDGSGNIYLAVDCEFTAGDIDFGLVKCNSVGMMTDYNVYETGVTGVAALQSLSLTDAGNITTSFSITFDTLKVNFFDFDLDPLHAPVHFKGSFYTSSLSTSDKGAVICGYVSDSAGTVITKLDSLGDTVYRKLIHPGSAYLGYSAEDTSGNVLIGGTYQIGGLFAAFVDKVSPTGTVLWSTPYDSPLGTYNEYVYGLDILADQSVIMAGLKEVAPGGSSYMKQIFIGHFSPTGVQTDQLEHVYSVPFLGGGGVLSVAENGNIAFSFARMTSEYWVLNACAGSCSYNLTGRVWRDDNLNCIQDGAEPGIAGAVVYTTTPVTFAITNASGDYYMYVPPGGYNVIQYIPPAFGGTCPPTGMYPVIVGAGVTSGINFGDTMNTVAADLRTAIFPGWSAPGFSHHSYVHYSHDGGVTVNGMVRYDQDPWLTFVSSTPTPDSISGAEYFWKLPGFAAGDIGFIDIINDVDTAITFGDTIVYHSEITPMVTDLYPADNIAHEVCDIFTPYDPNDKNGSPKGAGPTGLIAAEDSLISYTIRFQNTGTAPANNVVVMDTLDSDLDIAQFKMSGASHPYTVELFGSGVVRWTFSGIMLPDSGADEPGSHGYILYTLPQKKGLPIGTEFTNSASIYFDFQPPVKTNTSLHTLGMLLASEAPQQSGGFTVYPNPFSEEVFVQWDATLSTGRVKLELLDISGRKLSETEVDASLGYARTGTEHLVSGIYLMRIVGADEVRTVKLVKR